MHFLFARSWAHAANSRHAGGAAAMEDVSHDSDDGCRAGVDEWCAPSFQNPLQVRLSLKARLVTVFSPLLHPSCQSRPSVIYPSLLPWFVYPRYACKRSLQTHNAKLLAVFLALQRCILLAH